MPSKMTRVMIAASLAATMTGTAYAGVRWYHYNSEAPGSPVVVIKARCLAAEDSAAHLKLRSFSDKTVVYGCYKKGY